MTLSSAPSRCRAQRIIVPTALRFHLYCYGGQVDHPTSLALLGHTLHSHPGTLAPGAANAEPGSRCSYGCRPSLPLHWRQSLRLVALPVGSWDHKQALSRGLPGPGSGVSASFLDAEHALEELIRDKADAVLRHDLERICRPAAVKALHPLLHPPAQ